tara:strand:+ start:488 stop:1033 length:546 start_codon:yes stop_codon:yes gene_type:complete
MLELNSVSVFVEGRPLLKNIQFKVKSGQIIRLVAPNGGGKTTLIESILNLRSNFRGTIRKEFSEDDYGYLPQVSHQFPKIYLQLQDICNQEYSFYPKDLFFKNWHTSSGGERKKALIAKALSEGSKLIILDEPFNHLDPVSSKQVEEKLLELAKSGCCIIYTGHEYTIAESIDIEVNQWKS